MTRVGHDSLKTKATLNVNGQTYHYFSIPNAINSGLGDFSKLPFSLKVLLENLLRHEDGDTVTADDISAMNRWLDTKTSQHEIAYRPARVLMQDFTGVPAIVDLAAMRDAMKNLGADPKKISPLSPVDLVIDHSVQVDAFGSPSAFATNVTKEYERNKERYEFLRWGQMAFDNFRVVPPGTGICHQVNLEHLAKAVWTGERNGETYAFPDTLVGTDSHTTMINGLGVLGWGVGGIEAEAAMLGQPVSMLIPEVIGFKLTGKLREGITATDLVLTVTEKLRARGVVDKFVEFFGSGLHELSLADRATISNMAPEYGATCGFFPIDEETINYLRLTGRDEQTIKLVEAYCKAQGMWHDVNTPEPVFTDVLTLDLSTVEASLAGPKRPQDRVSLNNICKAFDSALTSHDKQADINTAYEVQNERFQLHHGDVVIAAITSCTNTSNPSVMMAAGLLAKKAIEKGLSTKPWVKTSLAPGSQVVTEYLHKANLQTYLDQLGFNLVGYGCTTCIGNSGPLPDAIAQTILQQDIVASAVLSGNRNFEGRVHPYVKANWLASPPLVVAFALAGTTRINLETQAIGEDKNGQAVYLKDIWPTNKEVAAEVTKVTREMFVNRYADVFSGDATWQGYDVTASETYHWNPNSTYIQNPPYFDGLTKQPSPVEDIKNACILALLGDSITTDHISPAGSFKANTPAGKYLEDKGIQAMDFNSYGARRGNHEVMMRGTFANIRIKNRMLDGVEGGFTRYIPTNEQMSIFDAAMKYQENSTPLVIIAGKEYGTGSSRDWAAKGTMLLGVKAVIAESFERIHRSNLIGMGVLPLQFEAGVNQSSLKLDGSEIITIAGLTQNMKPSMQIAVKIKRQDGTEDSFNTRCRIDTNNELEYFRNKGILHYVLRSLCPSA